MLNEPTDGGDDGDGEEYGSGKIPAHPVLLDLLLFLHLRPVPDGVQQVVFRHADFQRTFWRPHCTRRRTIVKQSGKAIATVCSYHRHHFVCS